MDEDKKKEKKKEKKKRKRVLCCRLLHSSCAGVGTFSRAEEGTLQFLRPFIRSPHQCRKKMSRILPDSVEAASGDEEEEGDKALSTVANGKDGALRVRSCCCSLL